MRHRAESVARVLILLAIGGMAGAAAFTHVHDLTVAHGQPDWIGWANAVAVELMAIYLGLEIRARRRNGRPVGLVGVLLVGFALLSLAAQVAEAEPSVWGWIVAAVPSLAFLALVKVVLSSAPATPEAAADRAPVELVTAVDEQPDPEPEPARQPEPSTHLPVPVVTSESVPSAVRPPLGVVRADRPQVVGIVR
ncbi:DUF2637 domain-containing protein [Plantactinospora sp. KLBMP9567]|uniref:DUF2637 domain-containing protein n=1 Tax=Plantactinospora sp. KLBMP9567 TaxID=3085900 RepID=UPI002980AE7F|nr:DUF2637 domain-containing protein [Plantactinospora sp. KLBMP9567]MDW5322886.1 DUF2637 domain-containing protein [Plantactinospora sp. KLBMP9567]